MEELKKMPLEDNYKVVSIANVTEYKTHYIILINQISGTVFSGWIKQRKNERTAKKLMEVSIKRNHRKQMKENSVC
jgi:hypothetical protein